MIEAFVVTKLEAAQRQLNFAIRLLFAQADEVAVHTLVGAASTILTDLMEHLAPERSWDTMAREANRLAPSEYFHIMRRPQNFFKHARDDHESSFEFDPADTEALAFWAVMNASELAPMSMEAQVFQLWYVAARSPFEYASVSPLREALELFGNLRKLPRHERLLAGQRVLTEQLARVV